MATDEQLQEMAARIVAQTGVTHEKALAVARTNLGRPVTGPAPSLSVPPSVLAAQDGRAEEEQQNDIIKLWVTLGGKVWNTSSKRRAKITPGWSDLMLTLPRWHFLLFWETKSADTVKRKHGGRSADQLEFAEHVQAGQAHYATGTFRDFVSWLITHVKPTERLYEIEAAIEKAGLSDRLVSDA